MAETSSRENEMGAEGSLKTGMRVAAPGQRRKETLKCGYGGVLGYLLLRTAILIIKAVARHKRKEGR